MVCSTISGILAIKHPELGILVREDGAVFNRAHGSCKGVFRYNWTFGCLDKTRGYMLARVKQKLFQIHRLVCECFHPNPENKPTVDHINRVRTDNRASNLRWATYHEQRENSSLVINRLDLGVRWCEDIAQYKKNWRQLRLEHCREYFRNYSRAWRKNKRSRQNIGSLEKQSPAS